MKKNLIVIQAALLLISSFTFFGCGDEGEDTPAPDDQAADQIDDEMTDPDPDPTAEAAPGFELNSVDGGTVSLSDFEGKPLVIFFFGSTCPLCIASGPTVESEVNGSFTSDEIAIIGIDTWDGNAAAVENFKSSTGITFDLLLQGSTVQNAYGTTYDRLFVVDSDGNIAFKGTSTASQDADDVVAIVRSLL